VQIQLKNTTGKRAGNIKVRNDVFGVPMNPSLVHQVMVGQLANARQGTVGVKTRGLVSGGGRKPRPQKHTGSARVGTIRSPINKGGGVVFGPQARSFRHHTPKRMRRQSLVTALSDKVRHGELIVLKEIALETNKTKELRIVLDALGAETSTLLVADGADGAVLRCARNVPRLKMIPAALLNTLDLLKYQKLVMTVDAVRKAEDLWGGASERRRKTTAQAVAEA
jgi:large subunit ribosomal protein L4